MNDKLFDRPVFVKGGSFTIVEIASLRDAIDFLDEWPVELQDVPYDAIRRAVTPLWMALIRLVPRATISPNGQRPRKFWRTFRPFRHG